MCFERPRREQIGQGAACVQTCSGAGAPVPTCCLHGADDRAAGCHAGLPVVPTHAQARAWPMIRPGGGCSTLMCARALARMTGHPRASRACRRQTTLTHPSSTASSSTSTSSVRGRRRGHCCAAPARRLGATRYCGWFASLSRNKWEYHLFEKRGYRLFDRPCRPLSAAQGASRLRMRSGETSTAVYIHSTRPRRAWSNRLLLLRPPQLSLRRPSAWCHDEEPTQELLTLVAIATTKGTLRVLSGHAQGTILFSVGRAQWLCSGTSCTVRLRAMTSLRFENLL